MNIMRPSLPAYPESDHHAKRLLLLSLCLSLLIHLVTLLPFLHAPIALDDMYQYDMLARSLEAGQGFRWYSAADIEVLRPYYARFLDLAHMEFPEAGIPTAFRAPGYPFFLAGLYALTPASAHVMVARVAQAMLMSLLAPICFCFAKRLPLTNQQSLLTAITASSYPILLFYPVGLASENLYIPLGALSTLVLWRLPEKQGIFPLMLGGLLFGATLLTRSIFLPFTLLAAAWLCVFHPRRHLAALLFLMTALLVCLPWSMRNSGIMGRPAFVENSLGYNLFIGYHPQGDGGFVSSIAIQPMNILSDSERDAACLSQAFTYIRQAPLRAASRFFTRAVKFFGPETREFIYFYSNNLVGQLPGLALLLIYLLLTLPWGLTLNLGMRGLNVVRNDPFHWLVLALLMGYALPHLFIISEPRFHLALIPVLLPLSFKGAQHLSVRSVVTLRHTSSLFRCLQLGILLLFLCGLVLTLVDFLPLFAPGGNTLHLPY